MAENPVQTENPLVILLPQVQPVEGATESLMWRAVLIGLNSINVLMFAFKQGLSG